MRATQRLDQRGFEAYLVGGCVRDLLLGLRPKDYDIATEARPQQVKRTFPRNSRIIGRRFKLAHLHFHGNTKILEVSTFRRTPQAENQDSAEADLLIRHDNEFGTAEEDALRRDFTVNALFLDVGRNCILDYTNGLEDLYNRTIRTIGDPRVRFREDPVRILRAAKFAGRLSFHVEPETLAAMAEVAPDLVRAAPPRVLEEILRLLRSGHALDSFQLLRDVGALKHLLPVVAKFLQEAAHQERVQFWRILEALDHRVAEGQKVGAQLPQNGLLLGVLMLPAVLARCAQQPHKSPSTVAEEVLGPLCAQLRLPRRDTGCVKRICGVAHRFYQFDDPHGFKVAAFATSPYFEEALQLFELRVEASGTATHLLHQWHAAAEHALGQRRHGDFGPMHEGEESDDFDTGSSEASADVPAGGDGPRGQGQSHGEDERGGRRRRRRRRRGGQGGPEFDAPRGGTEPLAADADDGPHGDFEQRERDGSDESIGDGAETDGNASEARKVEGQSVGADDRGEGGRRGRRRRRRGGRDRDDRQPLPQGTHEGGAEGSHPDQAHAQVDEGAHQQSRRHDQRRNPQGSQQAQQARREPRPEGGQHGGGQQGGDRQGKKNRRDRQRERRGRRDGAPRDVDVVPRGADRRGKVDVIEPTQLDLTAFDIELDPKRVPTFGSIVEGKDRPKRKPPRMPDQGRDDYRPPPPPGQDDDPINAPPPPVDDTPSGGDTFGDW